MIVEEPASAQSSDSTAGLSPLFNVDTRSPEWPALPQSCPVGNQGIESKIGVVEQQEGADKLLSPLGKDTAMVPEQTVTLPVSPVSDSTVVLFSPLGNDTAAADLCLKQTVTLPVSDGTVVPFSPLGDGTVGHMGNSSTSFISSGSSEDLNPLFNVDTRSPEQPALPQFRVRVRVRVRARVRVRVRVRVCICNINLRNISLIS